MIYILKIGYQAYVLPSNRGLATVMETLSRARMVKDDDRYAGGGLTTDEKCVACSVECVPGYSFSASKTREVIEPEVMPRDRTGDVGVEARRLALMGPAAREKAFALEAIRRHRAELKCEVRRMIGDGR